MARPAPRCARSSWTSWTRCSPARPTSARKPPATRPMRQTRCAWRRKRRRATRRRHHRPLGGLVPLRPDTIRTSLWTRPWFSCYRRRGSPRLTSPSSARRKRNSSTSRTSGAVLLPLTWRRAGRVSWASSGAYRRGGSSALGRRRGRAWSIARASRTRVASESPAVALAHRRQASRTGSTTARRSRRAQRTRTASSLWLAVRWQNGDQGQLAGCSRSRRGSEGALRAPLGRIHLGRRPKNRRGGHPLGPWTPRSSARRWAWAPSPRSSRACLRAPYDALQRFTGCLRLPGPRARLRTPGTPTPSAWGSRGPQPYAARRTRAPPRPRWGSNRWVSRSPPLPRRPTWPSWSSRTARRCRTTLRARPRARWRASGARLSSVRSSLDAPTA
jgi:hypothetical protein